MKNIQGILKQELSVESPDYYQIFCSLKEDHGFTAFELIRAYYMMLFLTEYSDVTDLSAAWGKFDREHKLTDFLRIEAKKTRAKEFTVTTELGAHRQAVAKDLKIPAHQTFDRMNTERFVWHCYYWLHTKHNAKKAPASRPPLEEQLNYIKKYTTLEIN